MLLRRAFSVASVFAVCALLLCSPSASADDGWEAIFDGRTLENWDGNPAFWSVRDGAITGKTTKENPTKGNTFIIWRGGEVGDFELKLQYKIVGGNSGIQYRSFEVEKNKWVVGGYQADIDSGTRYSGINYGERFRGILADRGQNAAIAEDGKKSVTEQFADQAELQKTIKQEEWNDYHIVAKGNHFVHIINGVKMSELTDNDRNGRALGILALQLHAGPPMTVQFRKIQIKRTGEKKTAAVDLKKKRDVAASEQPVSRIKRSDAPANATEPAGTALRSVRPAESGLSGYAAVKDVPVRDKRVAFVAGVRSHNYAAHEHKAGSILLARKLEEAMPNLKPVVFTNGWPQDPNALDGFDCIVMYCDGGGRHFVNPHLDQVDAYAKQGVGIVCLHYGVEVPIGPSGEAFLNWIGGYFETDWSVNPHWTANFKEFPEHPIANGVKPFSTNDEWYYHMRFRPEMQGVTPILTDLPPASTLVREDGSLARPDNAHNNNPHVRKAVLERKEPQHVAWAATRPNGGRGFGFTGGHNHWNWGNPDQLKLVLNAITWCAKAEVPDGGVPASEVTLDELKKNQDYEPKANFDFGRIQRMLDEWHGRKSLALAPAAAERLTPQAENAPKSAGDGKLFQSPVVTKATKGHSVDINVELKGAKSLFLVASDGGDGYGCDWADWVNPRFVGPEGEKSLTELKWKSAVAGFGSVNVNRNCTGGEARVDGKPVGKCIGTHANSVVEFDVPAGMTHFKATGALDNGGTNQGCGSTVAFAVYSKKPNLGSIAPSSGGGSRDAADALAQLDIAEGLEATLFASEASDPAVLSISAIDIDHKGRVWVCEVVNYRHRKGERPEGDRIIVLEDTDADGIADKHTVFYQGNEVDTAHGICVLGKRVIISAGDRVMNFWDDNGDTKADRHDVMFQGISGTQHDHGIHAFAFGPDGKLYFNFGNSGKQIKDKDGNVITDAAGNAVVAERKPYQEGMAFRCDLDGANLETVGWNFRNNWELCVDSFGTIWQSDNDDDGNRGVRINYVMEYGNYGYKDEFTGAGWRDARTNLEAEIPLRHWHLNDPGVVPNLLQTGAGAPTGICLYEGNLLPEVFHGQIIHCDAGPNVVRAYPVSNDGAGYKAWIQNILVGTRDKWFRPSDVVVAPDGSLIISDWYDPGVGGHRMGDAEKGRLFRVAPSNSPYNVPKYDFETIDGAIVALQSPNLEARYLAWQKLHSEGDKAVPALTKLFKESDNPRLRARALWLLGKNHDGGEKAVAVAIGDSDANIRILGLRLARQLGIDLIPIVKQLVNDPSAQVRRECAIALRFNHSSDKANLWAQLALQHDGEDRWYLEALGISAALDWDACLNALMDQVQSGGESVFPGAKAWLDIVWRSRSSRTPELLAMQIGTGNAPNADLPRYMRAFDFQKGDKESVLFNLAFGYDGRGDQERANFVNSEAIKRLGSGIKSRDGAVVALNKLLDRVAGTSQFVDLVTRFEMADRYPAVLELAASHPEEQLGVDAISSLLGKGQQKLVAAALNSDDEKLALATVRVITVSGHGGAVGPLLQVMQNEDKPAELRRQAALAIGSSRNGAQRLLELAKKDEIDAQLIPAVAAKLHAAQSRGIREEAEKLFPLPPSKDARPLPPIAELVGRKGDVARGRKVFETTGTCAKCHVVNGKGKEVGPNLSEIGKKLSRTAFFESIIFPSAGIAHNYEMYAVILNDGNVVNGVLTSQTDQAVTVKNAEAISRTIPMSEVDEIINQKVSIMPADLQKLLSEQDLVDVVDYLQTLKKAQQ
ncbi:MAG: PVC-type heme-binding CxxCH protein [Planctomycetota bacterium]|jgi:putative membrane-bound dehydrogenase-like protein